MKLIEYKPDISPVRTAIFEALWPIREHQRRQVMEDVHCAEYYYGGSVIMITGSVIEVSEIDYGFATIYGLPRGRTLKASVNDVLTKTEPI